MASNCARDTKEIKKMFTTCNLKSSKTLNLGIEASTHNNENETHTAAYYSNDESRA
jgi:hypothetical protein